MNYVIKWTVGLLLACTFMASAVCRADEVQFIQPDEGVIEQDWQPLGLGGDECSGPPAHVPLPAAVWAGLAGGAGVFLKRRRHAKQ